MLRCMIALVALFVLHRFLRVAWCLRGEESAHASATSRHYVRRCHLSATENLSRFDHAWLWSLINWVLTCIISRRLRCPNAANVVLLLTFMFFKAVIIFEIASLFIIEVNFDREFRSVIICSPIVQFMLVKAFLDSNGLVSYFWRSCLHSIHAAIVIAILIRGTIHAKEIKTLISSLRIYR